MKNLIVLILVLSLTGCSLSAYTNNPLNTHTQPSSHASFNVQDNRGNGDVLFLLALSGGGSRAAYLSAATMLKLQSYFQRYRHAEGG